MKQFSATTVNCETPSSCSIYLLLQLLLFCCCKFGSMLLALSPVVLSQLLLLLLFAVFLLLLPCCCCCCCCLQYSRCSGGTELAMLWCTILSQSSVLSNLGTETSTARCRGRISQTVLLYSNTTIVLYAALFTTALSHSCIFGTVHSCFFVA